MSETDLRKNPPDLCYADSREREQARDTLIEALEARVEAATEPDAVSILVPLGELRAVLEELRLTEDYQSDMALEAKNEW